MSKQRMPGSVEDDVLETNGLTLGLPASGASVSTAMVGVAGAGSTDSIVGLLNGVLEVAAQSALQGLAAGVVDAVYVRARTTAGDGGGGLFYWDGSDLSAEVAADPQKGIYVPPTSDTSGASGAWVRRYGDAIDVKWFGAAGDGVADDATALSEALAHGSHVVMPAGTYRVASTVLIPEKCWLQGSGRNTIIKAADGLDAIILQNESGNTPGDDDIRLSDFAIDGNKANQTPMTEGTGIKLYFINRAILKHLYIHDCEGHGIHFNNQGQTITGQRIDHVVVSACGSGAGNTFGSNFAITNGADVVLTACDARESAKAGYRLSGKGFVLNGCIAKGNGNGGLLPVSGDAIDFTINGGEFSDNGPNSNNDGIRLVDCDRFELNGVIASGNYGAGLHILNGCNGVTVNGGTFRNNGRHANAPGTNEARSGIAITNSGAICTNIIIDGAKLLDDQGGSATQDYGLQIADGANNVVADKCVFSGNQTGPLAYTTSANDVRIGNLNVGLALPYQDNADVALTGTTATTDLKSRTIAADEFGRRGALRGRFAAECAGAAGTKTFSLVFGGGGPIEAVVTASGSTDDVVIEWEAYATSTAGLRVFLNARVGAASFKSDYTAVLVTMTSAWDMKVTGKLSDGADTITAKMFALERLR